MCAERSFPGRKNFYANGEVALRLACKGFEIQRQEKGCPWGGSSSRRLLQGTLRSSSRLRDRCMKWTGEREVEGGAMEPRDQRWAFWNVKQKNRACFQCGMCEVWQEPRRDTGSCTWVCCSRRNSKDVITGSQSVLLSLEAPHNLSKVGSIMVCSSAPAAVWTSTVAGSGGLSDSRGLTCPLPFVKHVVFLSETVRTLSVGPLPSKGFFCVRWSEGPISVADGKLHFLKSVISEGRLGLSTTGMRVPCH